jgi:hypothetical protein
MQGIAIPAKSKLGFSHIDTKEYQQSCSQYEHGKPVGSVNMRQPLTFSRVACLTIVGRLYTHHPSHVSG